METIVHLRCQASAYYFPHAAYNHLRMKPSRPRIFIVSKLAKHTDPLKPKAIERMLEKADLSPEHQRHSSRRKPLFQEAFTRLTSHEKEQKYQYKLAEHIHVEPLGTLLHCDVISNQRPEPTSNEKRQAAQPNHPGKLEEAASPEVKQKQPTQNEIHSEINNEEAQSAHNHTFTSPRVRIFSGLLSDFKSNAHLSSLSPLSHRRRGIFARHESHPHLRSVNTSRSKERRRIFSTDQKASMLQPLPLEERKLLPLQPVIKEEVENSRLTELQESAQASRLPSPQIQL